MCFLNKNIEMIGLEGSGRLVSAFDTVEIFERLDRRHRGASVRVSTNGYLGIVNR